MPKVSDIYGSGDALKYDDLRGNTYTLRVASSHTKTFPAEGDMPAAQVIVLGFLGARKELKLNPTSARWLAEAFGDNSDAWIGEDVTVYPEAGKTAKFNAIYAKPAQGETPSTGPAPAPPPAPEPPPIDDSDIPF